MEEKICPLISGEKEEYCFRERCAFWAGKACCAITQIANLLQSFREVLIRTHGV